MTERTGPATLVWDSSETPRPEPRGIEQGGSVGDGEDRLRRIVEAVASGAGEGAAALRRSGLTLTLDDFALEVRVDADATMSAEVRIAFVSPTT